MKFRARHTLHRLGIEVARYPLHASLEGHLRWLLRKHEIKTVLDIGANVGQFAQRLRRDVKFGGHIVSFEPSPGALGTLRGSAAKDAKWDVFGLGLGTRDESLVLQQFEQSDWNSLHQLDPMKVGLSGRALTNIGSVQVDVRRLDGIWDEVVPHAGPVFLKSDTQGHDLQVLQGAGARLHQVVGLLLEASLLPFYDGEPDVITVLAEVQRLGFRATGFFPVSRTKGSLALDTVDISFVRST